MRKIKSILKYLMPVSLVVSAVALMFATPVHADEEYYSDEEYYLLSSDYYLYDDEDFGTDHQVLLDDAAGLLTEDEIYDIANLMYSEGVSFGNMILLTIDDAFGMTASDYQWSFYSYYYGEDADGVVFLVDMDNRKLWMQGYGDLKDEIDTDTANTIGDNIYKMASNEEYADCIMEGFRQIIRALGGFKITGPLKYIGNACLAVISALIITFIFAYIMSAARKAEDRELLDNIEKSINITNANVRKTHVEKIYDPPSSSSSGGSSGGGGGGGGHGF